jgi:hypothetical protein
MKPCHNLCCSRTLVFERITSLTPEASFFQLLPLRDNEVQKTVKNEGEWKPEEGFEPRSERGSSLIQIHHASSSHCVRQKSRRRDLNPRPNPYEGFALPAELLRHYIPTWGDYRHKGCELRAPAGEISAPAGRPTARNRDPQSLSFCWYIRAPAMETTSAMRPTRPRTTVTGESMRPASSLTEPSVSGASVAAGSVDSSA